MRAAIYARMSIDKQSADSPADQIARCRDFANARRLVELRTSVRKLEAAARRGDRRQISRGRAVLSRAKSELLWTLFSFGRCECPRPAETRFPSSARDAGAGDSLNRAYHVRELVKEV